MSAQVHPWPKADKQLRQSPPPSPEMLGLANERTTSLQAIFLGQGLRKQDVARFAQACYMLGVHDTSEALEEVGGMDR